MNRKILAVSSTVLLALGLLTPALVANAAPAKPLTVSEPCIPSAGSEAWDEIIVDAAAVNLWYSWTGGPSDTHDFPGADGDWQVDQGNHNGFDQSPGLLQRDKGNSGESDWFYHQVIAEQTHPVHHDAVPPVVCDPEDEPILEIGGYCYELLNAENPAAWENSGLQDFADKKLGIEDWTYEEKLALCGISEPDCDPVTLGFQSDWVSTEEGFDFPEHIQYPTDNIGWPPIYQANHTTLTQPLAEDCDPDVYPTPVLFDVEPGDPTCDTAGTFDTSVFPIIRDRYTLTVDRPFDGPGDYTITATATGEGTVLTGEVSKIVTVLGPDDELCPQLERCETSATQATATNLDPRGWEFEGAEWTEDGLLFTASNWSDAYAFHTTNFQLSQAGGLGLDLDINGDGVWAVILQTAAGNIHYEPAPYTLDLWTNAPGILPASPGGQGGDYAGNLEDIIGDPTITGVYLYFSTGSESPVTALLSSGSYNCITQPFAAAVEPVVEEPPTTPTLPVAGATLAMPLLYTAGALLLAGMTLAGIMLWRRKVTE